MNPLSLPTAAADASVYTDFSGLNQLKALAGRDSSAALGKVARQFEAVFTQMLLKSMREASFGGGILDSQESDAYRSLFDQQLAVTLSQRGPGLGIAAMLERQLGGRAARTSGPGADPVRSLGAAGGIEPEAASAAMTGSISGAAATSVATANDSDTMIGAIGGALRGFAQRWLPAGPQQFVEAMAPYAEAAAHRLGVSARALLAQAALETGWGTHMPRRTDGTPSFNLFGIKAGSGWAGERVSVPTLEFEGGLPVRRVDAFRAYASPAAAFHDFAQLLTSTPRYAAALGRGDDVRGFAAALVHGGYATDPDYADKVAALADSAPMRAALAALKNGLGLPSSRP